MYILIQADLLEKRDRLSLFKITNGLGDPEVQFYAGTFKVLESDEVVKLNSPPTTTSPERTAAYGQIP